MAIYAAGNVFGFAIVSLTPPTSLHDSQMTVIRCAMIIGSVFLLASRLKNIGLPAWYWVLGFLPLVGLFIVGVAFFTPPGYIERRKARKAALRKSTDSAKSLELKQCAGLCHFGPFGYARLLALVLLGIPFFNQDQYGHTLLPAGYFILLRWIVCPLLAVTAYRAYKAGGSAWTWVYGVDAAIFNPIFPSALGELWPLVDVITGALIIASFFLAFGRAPKAESRQPESECSHVLTRHEQGREYMRAPPLKDRPR